MCGIAGIIDKNNHVNKLELDSMIGVLEHRGPDNIGTYYDSCIGLAHSRLSIIDLNNSSNQPFNDDTDRYTIVFNGEIFNYINIRDNLKSKGIPFNTSGDTEVLLKGYIYFGLEILKKIQGFYAFCIYDRVTQELLLARDTLGKKPLYYYRDSQKFLFASEIKSIISVEKKSLEVNFDSMAHYLWKGYYARGDSAFKGINSLLPGQVLKINLKSLEIAELNVNNALKLRVSSRYHDRDISDLKNALIKSVNSRMVSDVPVSYLLSGGVDSSLVSYLGASESQEKIDTYYVGYEEDHFDLFEELAMNVSCSISSNHNVLKMSAPNISDALEKMISIFDEPFADFSALPSYELYKQIANKSKVAISGDGADEIFCGYKDSRYHLLKGYINKFAYNGKSEWLLSKIYKLVNSKSKSIRYAGFLFALLLLDDKRYSSATYRGGWNLLFRKEFLTQDGYALLGRGNIEKIEEQFFYDAGDNPIERYLNYDLTRLTYDFLVKIDRTSMANSVEVRSPFLDLQMINSINGVKTSNMVDFINTKKELKSILNSVGLNSVTSIQKKGFTPPLGNWLTTKSGRDSMAIMISDQESIINKIFNTKKLDKLFSSAKGISLNHSRAWSLLLLHSWYEANFKKK